MRSMSADAQHNENSGKQFGLGAVEFAVTRLLMRKATVVAAESISPAFRLIDLGGHDFRKRVWSPGHKVQVKFEGGLIARTYTPFRWNSSEGTMRILTYTHCKGPGSDWASTVQRGAQRWVFGPRPSVNLAELTPGTILFGDETSIGLAAAANEVFGVSGAVRCVFEVNSRIESAMACEALGIHAPVLIERCSSDNHLCDVQAAIMQHWNETSQIILTGKAQSIQLLMRALKASGVDRRRVRAKAYWAVGKVGLD